MRIMIDIGHPAHVHYFKNFISIMESKGHEFFVTARDKEVTHDLLKLNNMDYISRGKGRRGLLGKFFYIFQADYILWRLARKLKPDIFLSFASPYAAHVSWLMKKPHIVFDDTEHAKMAHALYADFSDVILSPSCFLEPFNKKQLFFDSYMELCYLHPKYFNADDSIYEVLGLTKKDRYVILRFVSWNANHDIGQEGFSNSMKYRLINEIGKYAKIFISSENKLPKDFEEYRLTVSPEKLHQVLAFADLYIGEGSTTASECSVLGVPNIYVNSLKVGQCDEQDKKYNICHVINDENSILDISKKILNTPAYRIEIEENHKRMLEDKIDITAFMVWFIENYPESAHILRENPEYQKRFT
ncbi:MAG: DUF354 domain-containing protein [Spirochaetaceae bacterium]|nr:DUF354 domain-containing protein [Spirochaetaceae bacterium]MCF7950051.1 DUF354 domain-containing protein [Spirochaetaceae bacterium]